MQCAGEMAEQAYIIFYLLSAMSVLHADILSTVAISHHSGEDGGMAAGAEFAATAEMGAAIPSMAAISAAILPHLETLEYLKFSFLALVLTGVSCVT